MSSMKRDRYWSNRNVSSKSVSRTAGKLSLGSRWRCSVSRLLSRQARQAGRPQEMAQRACYIPAQPPLSSADTTLHTGPPPLSCKEGHSSTGQGIWSDSMSYPQGLGELAASDTACRNRHTACCSTQQPHQGTPRNQHACLHACPRPAHTPGGIREQCSAGRRTHPPTHLFQRSGPRTST